MAMLCLDTASRIIVSDYNRSGRLIGHGEFLLEALFRDYPDHLSSEVAFISLWYGHAARVLLTQHFLQRAVRLVEGVTTWFPDNADIEVTRGLVAEAPVGWLASNLRGAVRTVIDENVVGAAAMTGTAPAPETFPYYRPFGSPNQGPYSVANNQYLKALAIDPSHARALLRLAWVRVRMRDSRAGETARQALEQAQDDDQRYLAHLLIAAAADVDEKPAVAIEAYSAARSVGARYQSACTGLASAYGSLGDTATASSVALECLSIEDDESHPDPWLTLRFGLTEPAIVTWLEAEARKP